MRPNLDNNISITKEQGDEIIALLTSLNEKLGASMLVTKTKQLDKKNDIDQMVEDAKQEFKELCLQYQ